jgi:hypothetical protein
MHLCSSDVRIDTTCSNTSNVPAHGLCYAKSKRFTSASGYRSYDCCRIIWPLLVTYMMLPTFRGTNCGSSHLVKRTGLLIRYPGRKCQGSNLGKDFVRKTALPVMQILSWPVLWANLSQIVCHQCGSTSCPFEIWLTSAIKSAF